MPAPSSALVHVLGTYREHIVSRFVTELERGDLPPPGLSRSLMVDHIPTFLDEIVGKLTRSELPATNPAAPGSSPTARQHGEQRWALGYDLQTLIREYGVLQHIILQTADELGVRLSNLEFDILATCTSVGVAEAAT